MKQGKEESQEHPLEEDLVAGASLVYWIHDHWDGLVKGETAEMRFAVLARQETIGFQMRKVEKTAEGALSEGQVAFRMKPSNWLISAFVDPIEMVFDQSSKKLLRMRGLIPAKLSDGKTWRNVKARIHYDYGKDASRSEPVPELLKRCLD